MLIFVQYPLADLRLFTGANTGRLQSPLWPVPKPYHEFVRSFGMVRKRGKGGIQGWIGENEICDAKHAVKFKSPTVISFPPSFNGKIQNIGIKCVSRHFYFDGTALAKLELVFVSDPKSVHLTPQEFSCFFKKFLECQVEIPGAIHTSRKTSIQNLSKAFTEAYLHSTTSKEFLGSIDYKHWVKAGEPLFWVEFSENESLPLPSKAHKIQTRANEEMNFNFWNVPTATNRELNGWIVKRQTDAQTGNEISRTARIMLTRLSAEYEVFWAVLNMLAHTKTDYNTNDKLVNEALEQLQRYFNEATRRIFRLMRSEGGFFEPEKIGDNVRRSMDSVIPGHAEGLIQILERLQIRPQVSKKIQDVFQIFITEANMGNIFIGNNKVTQNTTNNQYNVSGGTVISDNTVTGNIEVHNENKSELDYKKLAEELRALRDEMQNSATNGEHASEIEEVELAQQAAEANSKPAIQKALKKAGGWALTVAEKIGTPLAIAALKNAIGIP
ncbi:MAG: hypothetical protein J0L96_09550 [Anaerolineae bacterium]|nr:hypothetical protein [Anaerolineae bacterium]